MHKYSIYHVREIRHALRGPVDVVAQINGVYATFWHV